MKTKNKILTIILIIILLSLFVIIFNFSSQDAVTSKGLSRKITETIVAPVVGIDKLQGAEKEKALSKADKVVRKTAHFSIYTLVGACSMSILVVGLGNRIDNRNKLIIALLIGLIYAISDEIHQIFTLGRTALITDVIIDTMRCINRNINYIIFY